MRLHRQHLSPSHPLSQIDEMRSQVQEGVVPHIERIPCFLVVMEIQTNLQPSISWNLVPEASKIRIEAAGESNPGTWNEVEGVPQPHTRISREAFRVALVSLPVQQPSHRPDGNASELK